MKRTLFASVLLLALILPGGVLGQGNIEWVTEYNPAALEFPEGIAVYHGNIYVSITPLGQVRQLTPDGSESIFYQFPTGVMVTGLTVDVQGSVYVGTANMGTEHHGVWRITPAGEATHIPGTEAIGMPPNGLTFDNRGNLYVTASWVVGSDPYEGEIWRITPAGKAEPWYKDADFLGGFNYLGTGPIGANGVVFHHGNLYVANTERGHIVQIPVLPDGTPGLASIVASGLELLFIDGLTVDVQGILYAANVVQKKVVAVNLFTNEQKVLATEEDGLDGPASLTFGAGSEKVDTLYITNYGLLSPDSHPGVLRMELDWPVR